ncbi:MAG: hypothetical protein WBW51_04935 [Methyloceanibacter sp.]
MAKKKTGQKPRKTPPRPHLPDPKNATGPYRPFASDPGWNEAWWWLGLPLAVALLVVLTGGLAPAKYNAWIIPEGYGVLEFGQFLIMVAAFALAVRLLFNPFVRARPFVFAVTIIAALSSLFIAGEEMSWGQHFFHWNTPEYWAAVNVDDETNLHKTYDIFDKIPRVTLELGVLIGGLLVPAAAWFRPQIRASRFALLFPAAALVPTALLALCFKLLDEARARDLVLAYERPSESIEFYLYFFILAYLIVFSRRIGELETDEAKSKT